MVVRQVSVLFTKGIYGLLGANGSGKTTLLKLIGGSLKPDTGVVLCDDKNIEEMKEGYWDLLGYLPQDFGYYPQSSCLEFMEYMARLKGIPEKVAERKTRRIFKRVGLEKKEERKIGELSEEEKKRLGIAQCLLNDPQILLLDEPTTGLGPQQRKGVCDLIAELATERIVLWSTQMTTDVGLVASQLYEMRDGLLIELPQGCQVERRAW